MSPFKAELNGRKVDPDRGRPVDGCVENKIANVHRVVHETGELAAEVGAQLLTLDIRATATIRDWRDLREIQEQCYRVRSALRKLQGLYVTTT